MNWQMRIARESVLHALGITGTQKIPQDMNKVLENVTIYHRDFTPEKFTRPQLSGVTLIVRPLKRVSYDAGYGKIKFRKSSKHRTFILCPKCGREIQTGRFHQHVDTAICKGK